MKIADQKSDRVIAPVVMTDYVFVPRDQWVRRGTSHLSARGWLLGRAHNMRARLECPGASEVTTFERATPNPRSGLIRMTTQDDAKSIVRVRAPLTREWCLASEYLVVVSTNPSRRY